MPRRWLAPDFFTDEKIKKATVPERLLGAAIIANQDDDGRLRGDPAYLRAIAFLYDDYSLEEVKAMRDHLALVNPNILLYENVGEEYIQLKRYQRYQKPRYYHSSKFPAPPEWPFEDEPIQNEYKAGLEKAIQFEIAEKLRSGQWQPTGKKVIDVELNKRLGNLYADIVATVPTTPQAYILVEIKQYPLQFRDLGQILGYRAEMETRGYTPVKAFLIGNGCGNLDLKDAQSSLVTALNLDLSPLVTLTSDAVTPTIHSVKPTTVTLGKGEGKDKNKNLDLDLNKGEGTKLHSPPSLTSLPLEETLKEAFPLAFGKKPNSREIAQLRDLAKELSTAGGAMAEQIHDAFKEACVQNKFSVSYVRAILLDWLGVERS